MVEFRECFSNFLISILLIFNDLKVKNKFLLLMSSTLEHTIAKRIS